MKKSSYFIIQIIGSFILTVIICLLTLKTLVDTVPHEGVYQPQPGAYVPAGNMLMVGMLIYIILTIGYIIIGRIEVKEWRWWMVLVSLALGLAPVLFIIGCAVC